ncbi:alpha-amylase [Streptococcus dysgalactiae subsp. equisimilis]|nr:alpha-amylase [Streptococcus dysgalactiae subsp. equisimilis]
MAITMVFPETLLKLVFKEVLDKLTLLRKEAVYGQQVDYFDHANCIAWTCLGDEEHPHPLAVILSNGDEGWKHVEIGQDFVGQTFVDYLGHCSEKVVVAEDGWLDIKVEAGSISAWVPEERSF